MKQHAWVCAGDSTDGTTSPTPTATPHQHREPSLGNDAKFVHCHQTLSRHMLDDGVRMRSLIYSWAPQRAGFGGPAVTAADFPPPPSQQQQQPQQPSVSRDSRQRCDCVFVDSRYHVMTGFLMSVGRLHRLLRGTQRLLLHSEKKCWCSWPCAGFGDQ